MSVHDDETAGAKNSPKMVRPDKRNISRRNTVSFMYDELFAKSEISENNNDQAANKRIDKRSMKLQRGSERDLKLDISLAQNFSQPEMKENDPVIVVPPSTPQPSVQVESSKQFKSLTSKRVAPLSRRQARSVSGSFANGDLSFIKQCPPSRIEFHRTFGILISMGVPKDKGNDQRPGRKHISKEEALWQLEIKDLIWLELQAYHAGRSTDDEDNYICIARECIGSLLNEIMMYKFRRKKKRVSVESHDSGVETDDCSGCLSMFCTSCLEAQNDALREIEELLQRLEKVEGLFMSSKAFAEVYPLYKSPEFVGRVKAMCLWYNMMKHQRLKLAILGRMLAFLENKYFHWPTTVSYDGCSADSTSPSDSNSSNSSVDYLVDKAPLDIYAHHLFIVNKSMDIKTNPYRKYIENILKTRGLNKSMQFLEKLHSDILNRAQITLEKPGDSEIFVNSIPTEHDHDLELIRFGCHSPEAKSLDLPSYKAVFLFLSTVPLKVIHEFLLMRLEQKPKNPSPLSIRQLTRELKDGIRIATRHRERVLTNYHVALQGSNKEAKEFYVQTLDSFDDTVQEVFKDYLEYLEEWALLQHDNFQKNLLEEEWKFICEVAPSIQGPDLRKLGWQLAMKKVTSILCKLMSGIGERLMERIDEIQAEIQHESDDDVNQKNTILIILRELQGVFKDEREMVAKTTAFARTVLKNNTHHLNIDIIEDFKHQYVQLKCSIANAIEKAQVMCESLPMEHLDEIDKMTLAVRCREILLQGYKFGFEFYKEMSDFIPKGAREKLARSMIQFAKLWMKFTMERCERGRGRRPRWAYQGLDFLLTVCEPQNTMYLTDLEFDDLKKNMDACISHVIGSITPEAHTAKTLEFARSPSLYYRSRGSSPSPRSSTRPPYKTQRSGNRKKSVESSPEQSQVESPKCVSLSEGLEKANRKAVMRQERVLAAVQDLEDSLDNKLKEAELIGTVMNCPKEANLKAHFRRRHVTFTWQRGIKIGQGRFGKVYTAVNNTTGEMMAMKEISIPPNDVLTTRKVTEEIKILEGINHRNIVRYYGLEIHKEEMLIFMEFCPEGTLESLVAGTENGLPEILIRKYTYQLVNGVATLHAHGIVHRDIKTANIFLAEEGNCLKIGDFGCAVKIKSHTTMPGELQGFIGTQAYMAPEMFMKTQVNGHGRAADIWSIGCVVVEMATGKRPWVNFDSNYQIMFRVGMGDRPEAPDTLIDEGHDFLDRCLQHNAKERATAAELLQHNFVKIGEEDG